MGHMLEGLNILDLSTYLPGPYCTMLLCDLGANVIKIEKPEIGDPGRVVSKSLFKQLNRGKKSIKLNLKKKEGVKAFLRLAKQADVIVESFTAGVVQRLGIDYEAVCEVNKQIIYCSISGYGQDGPMRGKPCHDLNIISMTGIQHMMRVKEGPPIIPSVLIADTATGSMAAFAIMSALWQRAVKGKGQYLDISMYDVCFSWQNDHVALLNSGLDYEPGAGMLNGDLPNYNLYETADGKFISIGALEPHFWKEICRLVDKKHLSEKGLVFGKEAEQARDEMKEHFLTRTAGQWLDILEPAGLCVAPVLSLRESLEHPQAKYRNVLISANLNEEKNIQLNCPVKGEGIKPAIVGNGPKLGEHNREVFREIGMSEEEINQICDLEDFSS